MEKIREINCRKIILFRVCSTSSCTDAKRNGNNAVAAKCIEAQQSKCYQLPLAKVSRTDISPCLSLL